MRSLLTQLSLLVGILTATNIGTASATPVMAALWGLGVGFATYAILLLGDFAVHRFLEDSVETARIVDGAPYVELDERDEMDDLTTTAAA